jgi:hypothetical protein
MPGFPLSFAMHETEIADLADAAIADLADRLAMRAFRPLGTGGDADVTAPADGDALATLHVLAHLQRAVARQADRAAERAAEDGAGYPQLGRAYNITRQGARRRWPGLVPANGAALPDTDCQAPDRSDR